MHIASRLPLSDLRLPRPATMPRPAEVAAVAGAAVLAALLFVPRIVEGGFFDDDWQFLEQYRFAPEPGFFGAVENFDENSFRPGQMLYWPVKYALFGADPSAHLTWSVAWAIVMSVALFVLLRQLGVARTHSAVIAILVLICPVADANRLWTGADVGPFAIALFLIGANVSLQAFRRSGALALSLHAAGLVLYLASVLTYEIAATAMLVSIALYAWCAPWRPAVTRWAVDVVAIGATLVFVTSNTFYDRLTLREQAEHAVTVAKGGAALITPALLPFGTPPRWLGLVVAAAVIAAAAMVLRRLPRDDARAGRLWRLLGAAAAGMVAAGVAWLMFVPSAEFAPLDPAQRNRVNGLASVGLVAFAYSVVLLAGELLAQWRGREVLRVAVPAVACAAIAAGYAVKIEQDGTAWNRAADDQAQILAVVIEAVGRPPRGSTIYTVGAPTYTPDDIPTFAATWDLKGALVNRWSDATLHAYPMDATSKYSCARDSITMYSGNDIFEVQKGTYGRTFVVDVPRRRSIPVRSGADCRSLASVVGTIEQVSAG